MLAPRKRHPDALDAVSCYLSTQALDDAATALGRFPGCGLEEALNGNQVACKRWLIDELHAALGGRFGTVYVLGGWYGLLGALLLSDSRFTIRRVLSIDIDPSCQAIASSLNCGQARIGRFRAVVASAGSIDYPRTHEVSGSGLGGLAGTAVANLVVNTSCEHMLPSDNWYQQIPIGMCQALQSNDYFSCAEHVNCVESLAAFKTQLPMRELLFEGTMRRRRYDRFMLIGRK